MSDTYRTPDSPLGRALAQGRLAAAAQRAEREELDRANRAAVDELRATLAALDPPLAVEVAMVRFDNSLGADLQRTARLDAEGAPPYSVKDDGRDPPRST